MIGGAVADEDADDAAGGPGRRCTLGRRRCTDGRTWGAARPSASAGGAVQTAVGATSPRRAVALNTPQREKAGGAARATVAAIASLPR